MPSAGLSIEGWHGREGAPKAKMLSRDRVRFEVAGGNYHLVAAFYFRRQAFVRFIGAEYNRIDASTVSQV